MISCFFKRNSFAALLIAGLFSLIISGCSGGGGGEEEKGITLSDGTGSTAFSVRWEDLTAEGDSPIRLLAQEEPINCAETGVAEVNAEVYDSSGRLLATGGPWDCDLHSGTIRGIPAGSDRKVMVKGVSAEGEPYFLGEVEDVTVLEGTTNSLGMIEMHANLHVDSGKLQYRTYPDENRNRFDGDIDLRKAGKIFLPDDIQKFELKDSVGNNIPIQAPRYSKYTYFEGTLDSETGYVYLSEFKTSSGISIDFPAGTELSEGNYRYEITTASGQVLQHPMNFPGKLEIQPVNESSMRYEWLEDGGLRLSWQNPSVSYNTTSMWLTNENWKDLFFIRIPPDVEEIIIPAEEIKKITNEKNPISAKWSLRMGIRNEDGMEYARAYSNTIEFDWDDITLDLLDYFPLENQNVWYHRLYDDDAENKIEYQTVEGSELIDNTAATKIVNRRKTDEGDVLDEYQLYSYDDQYIYRHGDYQYYTVWDEDTEGLELYNPPLTLKRFMRIGETHTANSRSVTPGGTINTPAWTYKLTGIEGISLSSGHFPVTLKFEVEEDLYSEEDIDNHLELWAKGVGIVFSEWPDGSTHENIDASINGHIENLSIPWTPQFQFHTYSNSIQNRFGGWLNIRKNGISVNESDIAAIQLRNHNYTKIPIINYEFGKYTDFDGSWDEQNQEVNISGPNYFTDFGILFPEDLDPAEGYYVWEITSVTGEVLTYPFYFPGKEILPVPDSSLMEYDWLSDGSLKLAWRNPSGDYDRIQIVIKTVDDIGGFYMSIDRNLNIQEITIPASSIGQMSQEYGNPAYMNWTVRTRALSLEGMNHARAYSDEVEIPWQTADSLFPMIYGASDTGPFIRRFSIETGFEEEIEISDIINPYGITVDDTSKKLYWTDYGSDKIFRADLTGANVEEIITSDLVFPCGIAVDEINHHIYWTDWGNHTIKRSSLDGTNIEILLDETQIIAPVGITLDVTNEVFYFADEDTYKIQRANLDGSNLTDIAINLPKPHGIVYYPEQQKLYWTNLSENTSAIQSSNTDGTSLTSIVTGMNWAMGITVDTLNNRIYYSRETEVRTCNLDGTDDKIAFSTEHMPFIVFIND